MDDSHTQRLLANIAAVRGRVAAAARRAGRDPEAVTLVAVTKTVSIEMAGLLLDAGIIDLGENRAQEGERKFAALGDRAHWHMIGHLQRNKVKNVLRFSHTVHSVDSERLLREISRRADALGVAPHIFLEVNISSEKSKFGLGPDEAGPLVALAREMPGVKVRGLMTMAPWDPDPETARPHFARLARLAGEIRESGEADDEFDLLSMGMSGDFEVAVEEGATHIRVGTALFEGL